MHQDGGISQFSSHVNIESNVYLIIIRVVLRPCLWVSTGDFSTYQINAHIHLINAYADGYGLWKH